MKLINKNSLADTVDAVNEALFFGNSLTVEQKTDIAGWIASRQGLPSSYWRMFAPTKKDFETGIKVFTGEPMNSRAGISHILGEEASSILLKLGIKNITVATALERSNKGFEAAMKRSLKAASNNEGKYCCGICTIAYWRHLAAGGLIKQQKRLNLGMKYLYSRRDGIGRWRSFPFYYTLLALSEIDLPSVKKELQYTAPDLEKLLKRLIGTGKYTVRRRVLVKKVLDLV